MNLSSGNLFAKLPRRSADEEFVTLLETPQLKIERIISQGHASPPGFWYDQPQAEWVALLSGEAVLQIEGEPSREMRSGDWLLIPAHTRHRVESTRNSEPIIWLAVHF